MRINNTWRSLLPYGLAIFSFSVMAQGSSPDSNDSKWGAHVGVEAKLGSKRHLGELDFFLPLLQDSNTLVFANLRGRGDDNSSREGNLGLGVRHMLDSGWNLGAYGYFDRRRSVYDNYFNQVTLGFEALGRDWDFRANGYLPIGDRSKSLGTTGGGASTATLSGTTIQVTTPGTTTREERALKGFDAEMGWRTPLFDSEANRQLRLYLGGYRFSDRGITVEGPRARAELALQQLSWFSKGSSLFLTAETQHDNARGTQSFLGVRLHIPFGATSKRTASLNAQERRMTAPIMRDVDIVTQSVATSTPALVESASITTNGESITVLDSATTTGAALPGAVAGAGANSTVILSGTFNTTATTTLQSGQTVMGSGSLAVKTASGHTATLPLPGGTVNATIAGVGSAASNPGFAMANNSTIDGLTVSLTRSGGSGAFGVYIVNVSGATIRNSTITGTETGANTSEGVVVGNNTSNITISNNTINAVSHAGQSAIAFIIANGGGGAAATVTGNTLSATGGTNNWAVVLNGATVNPGSTGNVKSAGTCNDFGINTGTLYFTDSTTCP